MRPLWIPPDLSLPARVCLSFVPNHFQYPGCYQSPLQLRVSKRACLIANPCGRRKMLPSCGSTSPTPRYVLDTGSSGPDTYLLVENQKLLPVDARRSRRAVTSRASAGLQPRDSEYIALCPPLPPTSFGRPSPSTTDLTALKGLMGHSISVPLPLVTFVVFMFPHRRVLTARALLLVLINAQVLFRCPNRR